MAADDRHASDSESLPTPRRRQSTAVLSDVPSDSGASFSPPSGIEDIDADLTIGLDDTDTGTFQLPDVGLEIGEELGRGGHGLIQSGIQTIFRRPVAIKTLLKEHREPRRLREFYAEALVTAYLQHPNIVPIYDLLEKDGDLRLVMKRIDGIAWNCLLHPRSTKDREAAKRRQLDDHLEILLKITDAVEYAHDQGILHRDIKPHNVMIGQYGEVLLMDWGCAVTYGACSLPGLRHVADIDRLTGTPAYMSPEMARARTEDIGPASDVYLLGGLLYEILTGQRPHPGREAKAVVIAAAKGKVIPPEQACPDRHIPEELSALCRYALQAKPHKRLQSAREFGARLRLYFRHREATSLVERARDFADKASAGDDTMEHFARAVTCLEQALEIWPRCREAKRELLSISLAYGRDAMAHQAYAIASIQAQNALTQAESMQEVEARQRAVSLRDEAKAAKNDIQQRQRHLRRMKQAMVVLGLIFLVGLGAAAVFSTSTLVQLQHEQAERQATQRLAAPTWAARAHDQLAAGELAAARELAELAVQLDAGQTEAHLVLIQLDLLQSDWSQAITGLRHHFNKQEGTEELITLLAGQNPDSENLEQGDRIAALLDDLSLSIAAQRLFSSQERQLAAWQQRLRKLYPKHSQQLSRDTNGTLKLYLRDIEDLLPLAEAGIPIQHLTISSRYLNQLDGIEQLPLEQLWLDASAVSDLSPLISLNKLSHLNLRQCRARTLLPLRRLPVTNLTIYRFRDTVDISALSDMSELESLAIYFSRSTAVPNSLLSSLALTDLHLENAKITDDDIQANNMNLKQLRLNSCTLPATLMKQLTDMPISNLSLSRCYGLNDLTPLINPKLRTLTVTGCPTVSLDPLQGSQVQHLSISDIANSSAAALKDLPLKKIHLGNGIRLSDFSLLKDIPDLQISADGSRTPCSDFWPAYDLLQKLSGKDHGTLRDRCRFENGQLYSLELHNLPFADLKQILDFKHLRELRIDSTKVTSLQALAALQIRRINISYTQIRSLNGLNPAILEQLSCLDTPLKDFNELKKFNNCRRRCPWLLLLTQSIDYAEYCKRMRFHPNRPWQSGKLYQVMVLKAQNKRKAAIAFCKEAMQKGDRYTKNIAKRMLEGLQ